MTDPLWPFFWYFLGIALVIMGVAAICSYAHGQKSSIKSDERGTVGLSILAGISILAGLLGVIGVIAAIATSGQEGAAVGGVLSALWAGWSFMWATIWWQWSKKKDEEVATNRVLMKQLLEQEDQQKE